MSSATYQVIEPIKSTPAAAKVIAGETPGNGQAFQSPDPSALNKATKKFKEEKEHPKTDKTQTANRLKTSRDEIATDEPYPAYQLADSLIEKTNVPELKSRNYFLKFAVPVAFLSWFFDSFVHYFWYGELEFEIIPSDGNELWMRSTIFVLLVAFGLFADYKSRTSIIESIKKLQVANIFRAKKQWELVVDILPQLVIAMDENARITRINRTVETWGIGKVNKVNGLYVSDFLKCLNENYTDDSWTSDWPDIWQQIKNKDLLERKVEKKHTAKTYQYTLRKIPDYDVNNDQCFAVLIIDDITARQSAEKSLKSQAQELEKKVNERTKELKQANRQLAQELQAKKTANEELEESQTCRLALLREIFTAQESERKRIARELHDSIGQSLGATKFKLEELLIDKQHIFNADYDEFTDVVTKLQSLIQEVRHISMDLRPALLDDLGTLVTLNWFCREFENTYTGISVEQIINVDESDISEDNKVVIFRIVQEAMNNIAKYAKATNIVLELSKYDYGMILRISDNGVGFEINSLKNKFNNTLNNDVDFPKCSFGLGSMRERAESTNGKFLIESSPGGGTFVVVSWENKETPAFAHS